MPEPTAVTSGTVARVATPPSPTIGPRRRRGSVRSASTPPAQPPTAMPASTTPMIPVYVSRLTPMYGASNLPARISRTSTAAEVVKTSEIASHPGSGTARAGRPSWGPTEGRVGRRAGHPLQPAPSAPYPTQRAARTCGPYWAAHRFPSDPSPPRRANIVRDLVQRDIEQGTFGGRVQTRFPPEPNGYLHIGHAKAISRRLRARRRVRRRLQPALRRHQPRHRGHVVRRRDHRRPRWLGYDAGEPLYACDYFEQLYDWAELLSRGQGVRRRPGRRDHLAPSAAATASPASSPRTATAAVEENLDLFRRMRAGEFADGSRVLRAKIDMQHENMQLRDPVMYRIRRGHHHRTGDALGDLPHLRLGARPERRASRASPTRSARSSSTATGRSTTGTSSSCRCRSTSRARPSSPGSSSPTRSRRSASSPRWSPTGSSTAGTTRGCRRCAGCAGAATRQRRSGSSAASSGSPGPTAGTRSNCSSRSCATSSTARRSAGWPCCVRCDW